MTDVHIINHTHWDREWFLTHEYTTAWVPPLIDSLTKLAESNPDYEYLLDGQTLAIEDLLKGHPEYRPKVEALITDGQLQIGPCYSQPDWRLVSGELQLRNLMMGLDDAASLGGSPEVVWLVDTFGHISQAPQLLSMVGLNAAYVWRGVPQMVPRFTWQGADGTELDAINLFGGYRNLYGITKTPDIAIERLVSETEKLADSYGGLPVPLFDGYDLDSEPEDPAMYYAELDVPPSVKVHASSPTRYAEASRAHAGAVPTITGELISGKYGSTFPGSLSARTYLKVLHHDAENAIHRRIEPLAVMAGLMNGGIGQSDQAAISEALEAANRTLLQNGVHDCICGVSIDQVHERMDRSYREVLTWANEKQQELMGTLLSGFAPGTYVVSTHAMSTSSVVRAGGVAIEADTQGVGVTPATSIAELRPVNRPVETFVWSNDHYEATIGADGLSLDGIGRMARLVVRRDDGDTYSSEPGPVLGELAMDGTPLVLDESDLDTTVRTSWSSTIDGLDITAIIDARFDQGPLVDFTIRLDSTGTAFRVDAHFETSIESETVHASMPFDVVERTHDDNDLLGFDIDPALASILMGQRETNHVTEFPFHDFVAMSSAVETRAVMAKGLRSYRSTSDGTISVALRRSVEWLALTGLQLRSGDAGPAMYVPGARSERWIEHRIGFAVLDGSIHASALHAVNEAFHNPPIVGTVAGTDADLPSVWTLLQADLPLTGLTESGDGPQVRLFNPTTSPHALSTPLVSGSLRGGESNPIDVVGPKQIITTPIGDVQAPAASDAAAVTTISAVPIRVGESRSRPDAAELAELESRIEQLQERIDDNVARQAEAVGNDQYRNRHENYVLDRERLELALSLELNRRLASSSSMVSIPDDPDPVIAELGAELNDLRIKRRIYDYVVAALP